MSDAEKAAYDAAMKLFESVANPKNWKLPTKPKTCATLAEASALRQAIVDQCGGAELRCNPRGGYTVTSRGYYHYIGA